MHNRSTGGHLVLETATFAQRIARDIALTPACAAGFDGWLHKLGQLGAAADSIFNAAASASSHGRGSRPARGTAAAASSAAGEDVGLLGFDANAWMSLVHELCDGLQRWHAEAARAAQASTAGAGEEAAVVVD